MLDYSDTTVTGARNILRRLARWNGGPILYLGHERLAAWQADRAAQICPTSVRHEITVLRGLYGWAVREGLLHTDPTTRLRMPRTRRYLPRPISEDRYRAALDTATPQMLAILGLAGWAGLRAVEIARLDWRDVDLPRAEIRFVGKGGREAVMPVSAPLVAALAALPGPRRGPVVPRLDGRPDHNLPHAISHRANDYLHAIGIDDTLHSLRHRFGTVVLEESGGDLRTAQEALRHASPASTAIYTKVRPSRLRGAVEGAARIGA